MDETPTLWQAKLARSGINVTLIYNGRVYFEFVYHPKPGQLRWAKSFTYADPSEIAPQLTDRLCKLVLNLRKDLEQ